MYEEELKKEVAGISYSVSLQSKDSEPGRELESTDALQVDEIPAEVMMPRKARKLYEAMQVCLTRLCLIVLVST